MKIKDFFETTPPYREVEVEDFRKIDFLGRFHLNIPELTLYCEKCNANLNFQGSTSSTVDTDIMIYVYVCNNCNETRKVFSVLQSISAENSGRAKCVKIGEYPVFGPPTPSKLISLIGPDKDNFLKGQRCENQGLGIGSYAYYRRVIESQKNRIIERIQKICELSEKNDELIKQLELAKQESQFSKAIDIIKQNLPSSLLINGYNPLKLLHKALSKGLHEMSDEECLALSNSIRTILTELCVRMDELLKEDKELKNAINLLLNPAQEPPHVQV